MKVKGEGAVVSVWSIVPSPLKSHSHLVIVLLIPRAALVKVTVKGEQPLVGVAVKSAWEPWAVI